MRRICYTIAMGVVASMAGAAYAAPGECTVSGYGTFDCDVALDGGGLTFALPDGQVFAFTLLDDDVGTAFLIDDDAQPGDRPEELREFRAEAGKPGCWMRDEDYRFCVLVEQE